MLADWVGSDSNCFIYQTDHLTLKAYWLQAQQRAKDALNKTYLNKALSIKPFESIQAYYDYAPTPLQSWAETVEINDQPQLFILEDATGAGKTEAALALTHRLVLLRVFILACRPWQHPMPCLLVLPTITKK